MSLISTIAPVQAATAAAQSNQPTQPPVQNPRGQITAEVQPLGTAGKTAAEATVTAARIPPVTASRTANGTSAARTGAEGRALAEDVQNDLETRQDIADAQAKRDADEALRKVIQKEVLSRIPVPVEAIPKLTGDVETVRTIGDPEDRTLDTVA